MPPVDGFKLDRGEPTEAALPASAVVDASEPGHDRQFNHTGTQPLGPPSAAAAPGDCRIDRCVVTGI